MTSQHQLRRRHALQLMAGATGAALLHACGQSSGSQMSLSLGTIPWVGQVPLYVAQEKGFYTEAGLDFSLKVFSSNGEYMAAFLANQVDSISPVSSEAVVLKSQGKDFKITMVQDNSVGGDGILARDSITRIEDFKGQKIAVDTSGVSYFFLLQILEEVGLSKADITAVNTDPTAAAAAFQSGRALLHEWRLQTGQ
ncbi:MAG: hypothetical protein DCF25_19090 [Leptolyngbya foveolarum]|uniref:SsuA/THI5-like domain-containing protein n=1 Tax=Leptolyngbya foveolarum TaxID=47253 RepID=A0A2W4TRL1_9CYAN|nr:MAG: hypothetical protein DCF25_19090 [Leptolyngbya foveolarum]